MAIWYHTYRRVLTSKILHHAWQGWRTLGVPGNVASVAGYVIDPEALVLLTCGVGRYDARLFDEMLDWLVASHELVSIQRLKNLRGDIPAAPRSVVSAVARRIASVSHRWRSLVEPPIEGGRTGESLFRDLDDGDLPVLEICDPDFEKSGLLRSVYRPQQRSRGPDVEQVPNLMLRMRLIFGHTSRADIMAYLIAQRGRPSGTSEIAGAAQYSKRAVINVLADLGRAGIINVNTDGRELTAVASPERWMGFLAWGEAMQRRREVAASQLVAESFVGETWAQRAVESAPWEDLLRDRVPQWISWRRIYQAWLTVHDWVRAEARAPRSTYLRNSIVRKMARELGEGWGEPLTRPRRYTGECIEESFAEDVLRSLDPFDPARPKKASARRLFDRVLGHFGLEKLETAVESWPGPDVEGWAAYLAQSDDFRIVQQSTPSGKRWRTLRSTRVEGELPLDDIDGARPSPAMAALWAELDARYADFRELSKLDRVEVVLRATQFCG